MANAHDMLPRLSGVWFDLDGEIADDPDLPFKITTPRTPMPGQRQLEIGHVYLEASEGGTGLIDVELDASTGRLVELTVIIWPEHEEGPRLEGIDMPGLPIFADHGLDSAAMMPTRRLHLPMRVRVHEDGRYVAFGDGAPDRFVRLSGVGFGFQSGRLIGIDVPR